MLSRMSSFWPWAAMAAALAADPRRTATRVDRPSRQSGIGEERQVSASGKLALAA
jgi:hypothetical protein